MHCIGVPCYALHWSALLCIALECLAMHCIGAPCYALHWSALLCIALECLAMQCDGMGWNGMDTTVLTDLFMCSAVSSCMKCDGWYRSVHF